MGHPLLDEFCRSHGQLRPEFFRRCQRVFRDEVTPVYDVGLIAQETIAQKDAEIAELKARLDSHSKAARRKTEAEVSA